MFQLFITFKIFEIFILKFTYIYNFFFLAAAKITQFLLIKFIKR